MEGRWGPDASQGETSCILARSASVFWRRTLAPNQRAGARQGMISRWIAPGTDFGKHSFIGDSSRPALRRHSSSRLLREFGGGWDCWTEKPLCLQVKDGLLDSARFMRGDAWSTTLRPSISRPTEAKTAFQCHWKGQVQTWSKIIG